MDSFCLLSSNWWITCHWESDPTQTLAYYSPNSENGYQSIKQCVYFTSASQRTGNLYRTHNRKLRWHTESDWSYDAVAKAYYALSILNTAALLSLTSPRNVNINTSSSCSWRVRCVSCSLILKMKLVPPSLPRSSYVPSSFWFIL